MWLSKLLGGQETDDSEPSRVQPAAMATRGTQQGRQRTAKSPGIGSFTAGKTKGFDPYNSGAFRKTSAWERVTRR